MKYNLRIIVLSMLALLPGCSTEPLSETEDLRQHNLMYEANPSNSTEWELFALTQKTRRFHNFKVARAQGYTLGPIYVPGMGNHYINEGLWDDTFELEKPEAMLYYPDENGVNQFLAVEYIVAGLATDPAPEGFIGSDDVWVYNTGINAWTLHVWVGVENPNGIFAATHPDY